MSRPLKVPKTYDYIRGLMETIVEKRCNTTITGATAGPAADDPRQAFPFGHRGPRPDESKESLDSSRGLHSRFGGGVE